MAPLTKATRRGGNKDEIICDDNSLSQAPIQPVARGRKTKASKDDKPSTPSNLAVDDSNIRRSEHIFGFPAPITNWLIQNAMYKQNEKNIYLVFTFFNIMMTTVPGALLLYYFGDGTWSNWRMHVCGVIYTVTNLLVWCKSFILCMHYSTHTPIFNRKGFWGLLNHVMPYGLCAFFGILPGQYFLHHIVMHHKEENIMPYDLSSTMQYNRG